MNSKENGIFEEEEEKNKIKSKLFFNKLKSNYFLMKVFDIMKKNKSLEMVKINKKLQKRLNIGDYKRYSELYSSIEIELKVISNKYYIFKNNNNIFIRINNKDKEYFHIYFDDSKEEIKRNYIDINDNLNKIKIIIDHQIKSFKNLFFDCICICINSINFKKFFRINITDMSRMFNGCYNLQNLNISNFNTNNVTNMSRMFYECQSLKELNISNFNTNNVTDLSYMF